MGKRHYSIKERRQAFHIEQGYEKKGMPVKRAWAIAWATVRKLGAGRKHAGGGHP
ncbi:MAG TPA: hypothetical protein VFR02_01810 [bacterium]|nr:hypothetical protein [bacterium]